MVLRCWLIVESNLKIKSPKGPGPPLGHNSPGNWGSRQHCQALGHPDWYQNYDDAFGGCHEGGFGEVYDFTSSSPFINLIVNYYENLC